MTSSGEPWSSSLHSYPISVRKKTLLVRNSHTIIGFSLHCQNIRQAGVGCQVRLVHELVKHSRLDDAGNAGFAKEYKRESETGLFDSILFFRTVGRAALIAYGQSMV